jgi:hypothetical protein
VPSKRLLRSRRRVRRIAVRGVPPAPSMYLARVVRLVEIEYDWEAALVSAARDLRPPSMSAARQLRQGGSRGEADAKVVAFTGRRKRS